MVKYQIYRVRDNVVITRTEGQVTESIRFPHSIFVEIVEEIKEFPDVEGYPVELEVSDGVMEVPYDEFFKLAHSLSAN